MEIEVRIDLINRSYRVQVGLTGAPGTPLSPVEYQAIQRFGEPVVQLGGTFTAGGLTFTLPAATARFPSQFPVNQIFSLDDFADAAARATLFRNTMESRIVAARDAVVSASPGVTGHFITTS